MSFLLEVMVVIKKYAVLVKVNYVRDFLLNEFMKKL